MERFKSAIAEADALLIATPEYNYGTTGALHGVVRGASPEVLVQMAPEKFDDAGRLTDEPTREFLRKHLETLVGWARKFPREDKTAG